MVEFCGALQLVKKKGELMVCGVAVGEKLSGLWSDSSDGRSIPERAYDNSGPVKDSNTWQMLSNRLVEKLTQLLHRNASRRWAESLEFSAADRRSASLLKRLEPSRATSAPKEAASRQSPAHGLIHGLQVLSGPLRTPEFHRVMCALVRASYQRA